MPQSADALVSPYPQSDVIKGIRWLTEPLKYPGSHGDLWTCTWADDGHLYTASDDTFGINHSVGDKSLGGIGGANLAFHRIEGLPPDHAITTVNAMQEYGGFGYRDALDSWKAMGLTCVDGVLYMTVSQHSGAQDYPDSIQRTYDCSIIKSTDHGKTWSAKRREPTFPSPRFSTPFFVEFGQNYQGAFDDYVYAVSSGCTWNNGSFMTLGRVPRTKLKDLRATDWEMFGGLDDNGMPTWWQWETGYWWRKWPAIFQWRGNTSMTGMQYVPAVKRFLLSQWAYANLDGPDPWARTFLHMYEAPHPWGPWHLVYLEPDFGKAWYNPCLPAKWFEDGGKRMWMIAAGDFANRRSKDHEQYGFFARKLELVL